MAKAAISEATVIVGANVASSFIQSTENYGIGLLSRKAIKIGGTAVNAMSLMKEVNNNKNMRAYDSRISKS